MQDTIDTTTSAEDLTNAKTVGDALNRAYPGHLWAIHSQAAHGILTIQNFMLPPKYGMLIRLPAVYSASELVRQSIRMAGELLERYNLSRGAYREDEWMSAPKRYGELIGDES